MTTLMLRHAAFRKSFFLLALLPLGYIAHSSSFVCFFSLSAFHRVVMNIVTVCFGCCCCCCSVPFNISIFLSFAEIFFKKLVLVALSVNCSRDGGSYVIVCPSGVLDGRRD